MSCVCQLLNKRICDDDDYTSDKEIHACYLCPLLGHALVALRYFMYFRFTDDAIFAHNEPYAGVSVLH